MTKRSLFVLGLSTLLLGCTVGGCDVLPKQQEGMKLSDALEDLGKGMCRLTDAQHGKKFGYMVADVTVTYNINAEGRLSKNASTNVSFSTPSTPYGKGEMGGAASTTQSHALTQGNQIIIHFQNPLFAKPETLVYTLSTGNSTTKPSGTPQNAADQISAIMKALFGDKNGEPPIDMGSRKPIPGELPG